MEEGNGRTKHWWRWRGPRMHVSEPGPGRRKIGKRRRLRRRTRPHDCPSRTWSIILFFFTPGRSWGSLSPSIANSDPTTTCPPPSLLRLPTPLERRGVCHGCTSLTSVQEKFERGKTKLTSQFKGTDNLTILRGAAAGGRTAVQDTRMCGGQQWREQSSDGPLAKRVMLYVFTSCANPRKYYYVR